MNKNKPNIKISVVIATYNGEKYIAEQLNSIIKQTYQPYEIIIQDDCSTDRTWEIINSYANVYQIIKVFKNDKQLGLNQNFITAFYRTSGNYIATSDQDDVWNSNKLEYYSKMIQKDDISLVFSDSYLCDSNLNIQKVIKFNDKTIYEIIWRSMIAGHTLLFKKEILYSLKNIEKIDFTYEWLINITARAYGEIKKINKPLTYWRRHNATVTNYFYHAPKVKYCSPAKTIFKVIVLLLKGNKYENFKWQFENIYLILCNFKNNSKIRGICKFLKYYKKETLFNILYSSFILFLIRKDLSIRSRINQLYTPFYKYYYYKRDGAGLRGA